MPRPAATAPDRARSGERPLAGGERIAKLLARAGIASRREIERMIDEGRVALDGVPLTTPATVLATLSGITVDGEPVAAPEAARLFLYHKPPGLLVTEYDPRGRPTIYDRLPKDLPRVVPVGRLDLATEGLLLLTTDGGFKRDLELPSTGVERAYRARVYGAVSQAQLETLIDGIEIDGIRYGPIDANLERRTGANSWIELVLTEGKNREVRRVLDYMGLEVSRLLRIRYGPFVLGDLPPGAIGEVREADLTGFRQALASKRPRGPERVTVQTPSSPNPRRMSASPANPPRHGEGDRRAPRRGGERGPAGSEKAKPPVGPQGHARSSVSSRPGVGQNATTRPSQQRTAPAAGPASPIPRPKNAVEASRPQSPGTTRALRSATKTDPGPRRTGARKPAETTPAREQAEAPTRPAKILRKPGWAKPKIKPNTRPPKKR